MIKDPIINKVPGDLEFENKCCNHKCSGCGSCCGEYLPLRKKDEFRINDFLIANPDFKPSFSIHNDTKNLYVICPFLDEKTNKCRIYDIRPYVCRDFKCDRNKELLKKKRYEYAKNADYNGFFNGSKTISWHALFFGEYEYDIIWRHLVIKTELGKELTREQEESLFPLEVDKYFKKGGE